MSHFDRTIYNLYMVKILYKVHTLYTVYTLYVIYTLYMVFTSKFFLISRFWAFFSKICEIFCVYQLLVTGAKYDKLIYTFFLVLLVFFLEKSGTPKFVLKIWFCIFWYINRPMLENSQFFIFERNSNYENLDFFLSLMTILDRYAN